jgi:hypothetical protein
MDLLTHESPSVQSYLTILQGVITRMASNSAGAKSWCVGLVSAIVVVIADKGSPAYVWIALLPIVLFCFLDAYYLGLERLFREIYNAFIRKLHTGTATVEDVFILPPGGTRVVARSAAAACLSLSIWPFYALMVATLFVVKCWVL